MGFTKKIPTLRASEYQDLERGVRTSEMIAIGCPYGSDFSFARRGSWFGWPFAVVRFADGVACTETGALPKTRRFPNTAVSGGP
jgi:hypothetical protein